MQSNDMRDHFITASIQVVADVLTNILSSSWEMGDNSSPEESRSRHLHLSRPSMKSEERRLRTFQHWPDSAPISPAELAAAGFFFIGPDDRVECFCCGGVLYDWFAEDDPIAEHKKFFPTCPFIQGQNVGNQQMLHARENQDCVDGQFLGMLQTLGIEDAIVDAQPEHPEIETEDGRLTTFVNWPAYAQISPESLATAGFFYKGQDDYVQCFCCDGSLRNWEHGDDPWVEHARWFPRCQFLLESRGRDFVNTIQDTYLDSAESNIYRPENPPINLQGDRDLTNDSTEDSSFRPEVLTDKVLGPGLKRIYHRSKGSSVSWCWLDVNGSRRGKRRSYRVVESPGSLTESSASLMDNSGTEEEAEEVTASVGSLDLSSPRLTSMIQSALQMGFSLNSVTRLVQSKFQQTRARYRSMSELVLDLLQTVQDQGSQAEDTGEPSRQRAAPSRTRRELEHQNEPAPNLEAPNMEEQLRRLKEERMCKVCMDRDVSILLVPCGHLVVCAECAPNLRRCPICRGAILDSMKAFLS